MSISKLSKFLPSLLIVFAAAFAVHAAIEGTVLLTVEIVHNSAAVILRDMATGDTVWLAPAGAHVAQRGCFSPDGREVAIRMGDGRLRIFRVDGGGFRDFLTTSGGLRLAANPWIHWLPSGHIYWVGGFGTGWSEWQGPHNRVFRIDAMTGVVDTVYKGESLSPIMSINRDGTIGYRHRRWDLTGVDTMVHYIGNCGAAMSMSSKIIATTTPYHRSVTFYHRDSLERCCTSLPYAQCWGGGCIDGPEYALGCAWECSPRARIDTTGLPPEVWDPRWATAPHAGDAWMTAVKGFGGSEGAFVFNRETKEYVFIDKNAFGGKTVIPSDFWPGPLPQMDVSLIQINKRSVVFTGDTLDTIAVSNSGVGTLSAVTVSSNTTWLTTSVSGTGNTQFVVLSVTADGLSAGIYRDTVVISGGGADNSATCFVTLSIGGALISPTDLVATQMPNSQGISLAWTDNSTDENGFVIERKTVAVPAWQAVATVGANSTTWQNTALVQSDIYTYRMRAFRGSDSSDYSNEASAPFVSATAIVITSPQAGDVWLARATATVSWTAGQDIGVLGIDVSTDGGETYHSVVSTGSVDSQRDTFTLAVPNVSSENVYVRLYEYNNPTFGARVEAGPITISNGANVDKRAISRGERQINLMFAGQKIPVQLPENGVLNVSLYTPSGRLLKKVLFPADFLKTRTDYEIDISDRKGLILCVVESNDRKQTFSIVHGGR